MDSTLRDAGVGVLVEQGVEDGAGLVAVLGEDVALPDVARAFAPGERRLVEGDVADEIEGVVVAADLLGQFVEEDPVVASSSTMACFRSASVHRSGRRRGRRSPCARSCACSPSATR